MYMWANEEMGVVVDSESIVVMNAAVLINGSQYCEALNLETWIFLFYA